MGHGDHRPCRVCQVTNRAPGLAHSQPSTHTAQCPHPPVVACPSACRMLSRNITALGLSLAQAFSHAASSPTMRVGRGGRARLRDRKGGRRKVMGRAGRTLRGTAWGRPVKGEPGGCKLTIPCPGLKHSSVIHAHACIFRLPIERSLHADRSLLGSE